MYVYKGTQLYILMTYCWVFKLSLDLDFVLYSAKFPIRVVPWGKCVTFKLTLKALHPVMYAPFSEIEFSTAPYG